MGYNLTGSDIEFQIDWLESELIERVYPTKEARIRVETRLAQLRFLKSMGVSTEEELK